MDKKKAIILGAEKGSMNIGDVTDEFFVGKGWLTYPDNCLMKGYASQFYGIPAGLPFEEADALVVTLGRTSMLPFDKTEDDEIEEVIRGCLTLPLQCAREYVQRRLGAREEGGRIVFVGSYAYRHPFSTGTAYCAAKAGLDMATKTMAWEVTDKGFTVNCVHPYHVEGTPMWEKVQAGVMQNKSMDRHEADEYAYKDVKMPLARPGELAAMIYNIVNSHETKWTSGSSIEMFGGTR